MNYIMGQRIYSMKAEGGEILSSSAKSKIYSEVRIKCDKLLPGVMMLIRKKI
jgi:hypothetical protein